MNEMIICNLMMFRQQQKMNNTMPAFRKQERKFNKQNSKPTSGKFHEWESGFPFNKNHQPSYLFEQKDSGHCTVIFSHSENLKLHQNINYIKQRHKQFQDHQEQSYASLSHQLTKIGKDIDKCSQSTCNKIQHMIEELQQLNASVNNLEEKQRIQNTQNLQEKYTNMESQKIKPLFSHIHGSNYKVMREYTQQGILLEQKIQESILKPKKQQQKQRGSELLKILNSSIHLAEEAQAQMEEMSRWSEGRLGALEETVEQLQLELERSVQRSSELRKREDKLVEQLIEKVIYKMTYL